MSYLDANEIDLEYVVNSKGAKFDLKNRVQYARAYLTGCKALGVDVMSLYSVTPYLGDGKALAEGYEWFGAHIDALMSEGAYILHVDDAKAFQQRMAEHKAKAKAAKASVKAERKAEQVQAGEKRPLKAGTSVRYSVTASGKVTLSGVEKSALKASTKGKLADMARAINAMSAEEREYLLSLLA